MFLVSLIHLNQLLYIQPEKKSKIQELIRDDIGTKWREFGRNLQIKEGKLDSIDYEHKEIERKIDAIFNVLEGQCLDEFMYVEEICNSLVVSRRKDLAKDVVRIMKLSFSIFNYSFEE